MTHTTSESNPAAQPSAGIGAGHTANVTPRDRVVEATGVRIGPRYALRADASPRRAGSATTATR
jgi:hypothetical protein